jgi:hypothetical protein
MGQISRSNLKVSSRSAALARGEPISHVAINQTDAIASRANRSRNPARTISTLDGLVNDSDVKQLANNIAIGSSIARDATIQNRAALEPDSRAG